MDNQPTPQRPAPQPITENESGIAKKSRRRFSLSRWILCVVAGLIVVFGAAFLLYQSWLRPVGGEPTPKTIEIVSGTTPDQIGELLKREGLIRNEMAFFVYTRLHGVQNNLQAGTYQLNSHQSTGEIVADLVAGPEIKEFEVTFLPGGTLTDHRKVLKGVGFSDKEIDEAFSAKYDSPLFVGRPTGADLEGYIYGETHRFVKGTSAKEVLDRYFKDFYDVVEEYNLVERYRRQGLSLYEGIILASIIQKEVSGEGDSRQVAQVFYKRMAEGIPLGADATFVYAAKKAGDAPRVDYPSPYNTRIHTGLPPGPISSPGVAALQAAGDPAEGDYLYFVSGDDGKNYFSRTEAEHIENTKKYCIENCALF